MVSNSHCQPNGFGSPAQAAPSPQIREFLHDFFSDPNTLHQVRRDVRTWFLSNLPQWDERFGSTLEAQINNYELLDELLSMLIIHPSKND